MRWFAAPVAALVLAGCGSESLPPHSEARAAPETAKALPLDYTETFRIYERDDYHIVDIEASVIAWGGASDGPKQRARLVLVPRETTQPELTGDLADATIIRTPVERIAVNEQVHEAILRALDVEDRIVAVGGHSSYDDEIRGRVKAGEIQQVGYGWHQPPTLDALVASRPDVFLVRMADLTHTQQIERVRALGIPVVPTFIDAEPHYMGRVEWVELVGLLVGREQEAQKFVSDVEQEVTRLKELASTQQRRSLLWAWYEGSGDRWSVTQRNADAALIRDANVELVLGKEDDPRLDTFSRLSTEQLLESATDADCWMIRDPLSTVYTRHDLLERFKAYREDCVFWQPGRRHPDADSWEVWEMGHIRPDWLLSDLIKIAHPELRDGDYRYFQPETWEAGDGGTGHN